MKCVKRVLTYDPFLNTIVILTFEVEAESGSKIKVIWPCFPAGAVAERQKECC